MATSTRRPPASMGPRAAARGNLRGSLSSPPISEASMGPRAAARGNKSEGGKVERALKASMGPRAAARGNGKIRNAYLREALLQWGREQLLAEIVLGGEFRR